MSLLKAGRTGVTAETPKNILFGAGTIHKNVTYTAGTGWNFEDSIIGATQGGSKLSIVPSFVDVEADGAVVLVKGLKVKTGEEASMEINFLEINQDIMKHALIGEEGTSEDPNFTVLQTKPDVTDGDYYDNVAFVGQTLDKRQIIVIMENVLCTSGFESEGKNKEAGVGKYTFTCHAEITGDLQTLPVKIYYPNTTTQTQGD
jgi:hypothetical protein